LNLKEEIQTCVGSCVIRKVGVDSLNYLETSLTIPPIAAYNKTDSLINLIYHDESYMIAHPGNRLDQPSNLNCSIDNSCWVVVSELPNKTHTVKIGEVLRFGRVCFKVTQIRLNDILETHKSLIDTEAKLKHEAKLHD
jgi:hypothetical protein